MVLVLATAGGVAALDAQSVFYLMPFIATEFALSSGQIGFIGSAVLIGWALGGIVIARASDRRGERKPFLIGAFCCFAMLSGLSALATGFLTLLAARLLIGIAEGPVIPVKQAMVMAESSPARRGLNMGIVQNLGAQLLGTLIAPILLVAIAQAFGWRAAFLAAGIPGLIIAFLVWRVLREPPRVADERSQPVQQPFPWRALLGNRNVLLCSCIALFTVAWFFILLTFLPLFLVRDLKVSPSSMSVIMSLIGLAGVTSAIIVPFLADRKGRRIAILTFSAVGALAPFGLLVAGSNLWLVGLVLVLGGQMLGVLPLIMATVPQESVAPQHRATATSMVIAIAQIGGGAAGPIAAGWLADRSGNGTAIMLAGILALVALVLTPFVRETLPRKQDGDAAPQPSVITA